MKIWRGQPDNWKAPVFTKKEKAHASLGLSGCLYLSAFSSYISPSDSSQTGKWGWLHRIFYTEFGASGDIILYSLIGSVFLFLGLSGLRERQSAGETRSKQTLD